MAGTGPRPMISGARPAEVDSTTRARGVRPYFWAARSETTRIAEAPSLREEELPAVTTPSFLMIGRRPASTSGVEPGRGPSSVSTTVSAPLRPVTTTGTISSVKRPASMAASARSCERAAKASASSRVMPSTSPTSSAVSGMEKVNFSPNSPSAKRGFTKRQPIAVSKAAPGLANAVVGFSITQGARDIDSTPPATTTSAIPERTIAVAMPIADMPEAQRRFTVMPGTVSGKPASSQAMRATLRFSSPAPLALPRMTSSTTDGSMPASSITALMVRAARSSGRTEERAPPYLPTGVRRPPTSRAWDCADIETP